MRGNFFEKKLSPPRLRPGECRRLIRLRPCIAWELAEIRFGKLLVFIEAIEKGNITIAFPLG